MKKTSVIFLVVVIAIGVTAILGVVFYQASIGTALTLDFTGQKQEPTISGQTPPNPQMLQQYQYNPPSTDDCTTEFVANDYSVNGELLSVDVDVNPSGGASAIMTWNLLSNIALNCVTEGEILKVEWWDLNGSVDGELAPGNMFDEEEFTLNSSTYQTVQSSVQDYETSLPLGTVGIQQRFLINGEEIGTACSAAIPDFHFDEGESTWTFDSWYWAENQNCQFNFDWPF
ncbi:hypothetical protein ACFL2B_01445 [Patescibacteria group bacterium]